MKSLQSHIRNPFVILIAAMLLIIMLLLNVSIRLYLNNGVKKDLREAKSVLVQLVNRKNNHKEPTPEDLAVLFEDFRRSLVFSNLQDDVELLLYDADGTLLYPSAGELPKLPHGLENITAKRLGNLRETRIYSFLGAKDRYFALPWHLADGGTLLLATPAAGVNRVVREVDLLLLTILLLGTTAAIVAANAAAKRIARPVTQLCEQMRSVGDGNFSQAIAITPTKIQEIAYLQQSASNMSAQLSAYDSAQKAFLANASHELKTPLMSIQGYAEGIAGGVLPDSKQAANVILRESKRLSELVSELLTLSRMDTAASRKLQPINLNQTLLEYEQRLLGAAAKQQRRLTLRLPEQAPIVMGDDELLYQAVMNVVSNCLRYAKEEVLIALTFSDSQAAIRISDDGNGISAEDLPHLFERFYKGKNGSFGLGLAIAQSAMAALRGSITAGNDNGAVFTLTLPLTNA